MRLGNLCGLAAGVFIFAAGTTDSIRRPTRLTLFRRRAAVAQYRIRGSAPRFAARIHDAAMLRAGDSQCSSRRLTARGCAKPHAATV